MTLAYESASSLLDLLTSGDISSVELLDELLARIDARDGEINAVVATAPGAARELAEKADAARARGEIWGKLHGLPMTIKDSIEVAGMPTTSGAPELAGHRPTRHADAVQRLVDEGAIVFGKTNVPLYTGDFQSYNEVYGTTNNPWNTERGPGGSSGGSAAALAAGFTPLELGSDIGGSIRNPAHFCGVYGHKPTRGIVSVRGNVPGPPGTLSIPDLVVLGPMARCPDDLELGLNAAAGPAASDEPAWRLTLPKSRHEEASRFRVAVWLEQTGFPISADVTDLMQSAVDRAADKVAIVDDKARPEFDPKFSHALYLRLLYSVIGSDPSGGALAEVANMLSPLHPSEQDVGSDATRALVDLHSTWLWDNEARSQLHAAWAAFFQKYDVLLCPIMPVAAFPHDHRPITQRTLNVDGKEISYLDPLFWAGLFTVSDLPATAVPIGRSAEGLPVGMQVVAPYLEDRTAIHFARLLEDLIGGFERPPGYAN